MTTTPTAPPVPAPPALDADIEDHDAGGNRFDRIRKTIGLFAGPAAFVLMLLLPLPLEANQQALAAVMVFVIIMWVTEALPIPITSLLAMALCVVLQIPTLEPDSTQDATAFVFGAFSSSTLFLVIGGFIIARAMSVHGLDRRFAISVLAIPGVAKSTTRVACAFGGVAAIVSAFVSNSAAAAMLLPIGLGIVRALGPEVAHAAGIKDFKHTRFATLVMLMIAYGASVGGLLTPIGSTANIVGRGFLEEQVGVSLNFVTWGQLTWPLVVVMFAAMCLTLWLFNRPEINKIEGATEYIRTERHAMGTMSRGEINTLICFLVAVVLWVGPSLVELIAAPETGALAAFAAIDEGTAALIGASLLFFLPLHWAQRKFTLSWSDAGRIDWGTVVLVGAGLVLGRLMANTGLAEVIGTGVAGGLGLTSGVAVTVLAVVLAIVISETTSNTAAVGVVVPVVIPIAVAVGMDPTIPTLAAVFGASCGFMLPVSTPPNAIVYGSGMVPITRMFRTGLVFDLLAIVIISGGVLAVTSVVTVGG